MERHYIDCHLSLSKVPHYCGQCHNRYQRKSSLTAHFSRRHKGEDRASLRKGCGGTFVLRSQSYRTLEEEVILCLARSCPTPRSRANQATSVDQEASEGSVPGSTPADSSGELREPRMEADLSGFLQGLDNPVENPLGLAPFQKPQRHAPSSQQPPSLPSGTGNEMDQQSVSSSATKPLAQTLSPQSGPITSSPAASPLVRGNIPAIQAHEVALASQESTGGQEKITTAPATPVGREQSAAGGSSPQAPGLDGQLTEVLFHCLTASRDMLVSLSSSGVGGSQQSTSTIAALKGLTQAIGQLNTSVQGQTAALQQLASRVLHQGTSISPSSNKQED